MQGSNEFGRLETNRYRSLVQGLSLEKAGFESTSLVPLISFDRILVSSQLVRRVSLELGFHLVDNLSSLDLKRIFNHMGIYSK